MCCYTDCPVKQFTIRCFMNCLDLYHLAQRQTADCMFFASYNQDCHNHSKALPPNNIAHVHFAEFMRWVRGQNHYPQLKEFWYITGNWNWLPTAQVTLLSTTLSQTRTSACETFKGTVDNMESKLWAKRQWSVRTYRVNCHIAKRESKWRVRSDQDNLGDKTTKQEKQQKEPCHL